MDPLSLTLAAKNKDSNGLTQQMWLKSWTSRAQNLSLQNLTRQISVKDWNRRALGIFEF
jgi:hypothetical protein